MSEVKVNKITPTTNCGTVTLGDSGDTVAIPCGVTLSNSGSITNSGTITNTGTISGGTITGTIDNQVNWDTTAKTAGFTAVAGNGYFVNTTSGAITVTLPATPSAGDLVGIKDYANTANTNNITIDRNGSNIQGTANNFTISVAGTSITLIYVDGTQGWVSTGAAKASDISEQQLFVTATGGTITTCGDYKIHTFTGPGTFCVSCAGNPAGSAQVDYMVVAGGGGGSQVPTPGAGGAGGGGAGGFRESGGTASGCYTTSPLGTCVSGLPLSAIGYPITVGAGGAGGTGGCSTPPSCAGSAGSTGSNSIFSSITSAGGGFGNTKSVCGGDGGSGGGAFGNGNPTSHGLGNTPPVSPPQGNPGGIRTGGDGGKGGGGATVAGAGPTGTDGGDGGAGATTSISFSPTAYGGGGGGGSYGNPDYGLGGTGGGGDGGVQPGPGATSNPGSNGTANTGGGGGGGAGTRAPAVPSGAGGSGGSGIVLSVTNINNE
jgi:hypothetical protein